MSLLGWLAWAVVIVAFAGVAWGVLADHRDYVELRADLDQANADRDELLVYVTHLAEYVTGQERLRPPTGRHAHTGEQAAA